MGHRMSFQEVASSETVKVHLFPVLWTSSIKALPVVPTDVYLCGASEHFINEPPPLTFGLTSSLFTQSARGQ